MIEVSIVEKLIEAKVGYSVAPIPGRADGKMKQSQQLKTHDS